MSKVYKGNCISIEQPSIIYCEEPCLPRPVKLPTKEKNSVQADAGVAERAGLVLEGPFEQPDGVLEKANEDAQKIIEDARREAEEIRREAYEAGYREGRETGKKEVLEQEATGVKQLEELMQHLSDGRDEMVKSAREEAIDFAFTLAGKIVDTEIDRNDEAFFNMCAKAAMRAGEAVRAVLRVGPREYVIASKYEKELQKCLGGLRDFEIELDETRTDTVACIIETDSGMVDASVDTQLRRARELIETSHIK